METQDKQNIKRKAFVMSAMMRNKDISQIISDSMDSSIGSTKRNKAKAVISSMKRANNIQDGKGGSSPWDNPNPFGNNPTNTDSLGQGVSTQYGNTAPQNDVDYLNRKNPFSSDNSAFEVPSSNHANDSVVKSIDDRLEKWSHTRPEVEGRSRLDTGAEAAAKFGVRFLGTFKDLNNYYKGQILYPVNTNIRNIGKNYASFAERVYDFATNKERKPFDLGIPYSWKTKNDGSKKDLTTTEKETKDQTTDIKAPSPEELQKNANEAYKTRIANGEDPKKAKYDVSFEFGIDPQVDIVNEELKNDPDYNPAYGVDQISKMTQEEIDNLKGSMDNSQNEYYDSIFKAAEDSIARGEDSMSFAMKMMGNTKQMAAMLDIPESEAAMYPQGLLSEHLVGLRNSIDLKYDLDKQLESLTENDNRSLGLSEEFTSYIRGKDEYLNELDSMIMDAREQMVNMDTSNPGVARRMNSYIDYLTTLAGKQNVRYIDFLETGIQENKNKMEAATNTYNLNVTRANQEYNEKSSVDSEFYTKMMATLQSIYNTVAGRDISELDYKLKKAQLEKTQADTLTKTLDNKKTKQEINGGSYGKEVTSSISNLFTSMYSNEQNEDGSRVFITYNPMEVMNSANLANQPSAYAVNSFMKDMGFTINKSSSSGTLSEFNRFKDSYVNNISSQIYDINNLSKEEEEKYNNMPEDKRNAMDALNKEYSELSNAMIEKMSINLSSGISSFLTDKMTELKLAIKDLNKYATTKKPNYSKFAKRNKEVLGDYTKPLFDYTLDTINSTDSVNNADDIFGDMDDDKLRTETGYALSNYLFK